MGSRRRRRGQRRGPASSGRRARRAAPPRGSRCAAAEPSVLQHPPAPCGPGNACRPPRCLKHSGMGGPRTAGRGSSTCLLAFCVFAAGLWIASSHTSKNFNPCHAEMVPKPLVCPLTTIGHPGRIATWLLHAPCSTELCPRGSYMLMQYGPLPTPPYCFFMYQAIVCLHLYHLSLLRVSLASISAEGHWNLCLYRTSHQCQQSYFALILHIVSSPVSPKTLFKAFKAKNFCQDLPQHGVPPVQGGGADVPSRREGGFTDTPNSNIRRITAARLLESKQSIPHYYVTSSVRVSGLCHPIAPPPPFLPPFPVSPPLPPVRSAPPFPGKH